MSPKTWNVESSTFAKNTFNPIRNIMENLQMKPNEEKEVISLSIGDPTKYESFEPPKEVTDAVMNVVKEGKCNGYAPSTGFESARAAIAKYASTVDSPLASKDIIICSGCSSSLDICIMALCSPGKSILVPRPGFPLYGTLAQGIGVSIRQYNLLPDKQWEIDLLMMEELIDETTAAIVINNPSNPCGSVFSKKHLLDILELAELYKIPIIADEIYADFVFKSEEFHWLASLSTTVPILSCGGLTKRWLVPGWRLGWIAINDRNGIFAKEVRNGLHCLSQRVMGGNTIVQGAIPTILAETPSHFYEDTIAKVELSAKLSYKLLKEIPGLTPIMPQGAMYMMVGIDMDKFHDISTDLQFVEKLLSEESVFCLPGKCFYLDNYIRLVMTISEKELLEACQRIKEFCLRHYVSITGIKNDINSNYNQEKHIISNGNMNGDHRKPLKSKRSMLIKGSSFDVTNPDEEEISVELEKKASLKQLIKSNSIIEVDE